MIVELDNYDLLKLVRGTGGPNSYIHPFSKYGSIVGFPNERWQWNEAYLKSLLDTQLWDLYQELKTFNK